MKRTHLVLLLAATACSPAVNSAPATSPAPTAGPEAPADVARTGLLVMAHGGTPEWNESVMDAVRPSSELLPTAVAFGMANPYTLQTALDELEEQGVTRVAVVRMFLSGESFLDQTEYFLGLTDERPEQFVLMGPAAADPAARTPLDHSMEIATHAPGILDSDYVSDIMVDRAGHLSQEPGEESVLLIAHGMGDEAENDRVLAAMSRASTRLRAHGYGDVEIATLREDWADKRVEAEAAIRDYVEAESRHRSVLVLPMRLSGFGPYADVLDGLDYEAGEGLLPHTDIGRWVLDTANDVTCAAGWGPVHNSCATVVADPSPSLQGRD